MDWDVLASKDSPLSSNSLILSLKVKFWCLRTNEKSDFSPSSQRKWVCFCSTGSASQLQLFRLLNPGPWQIKSIQKYPRSIQQLLSVLSLGLATIWILEFLENIFAARHLQGQWLVVRNTFCAQELFPLKTESLHWILILLRKFSPRQVWVLRFSVTDLQIKKA